MSKVLDTVDVAVLGCGAVGAAVAYFLARDGARVAVIERGGPGSGTSGRCEGNLLMATKTKEDMLLLAQESLRLFEKLSSELELPFSFEREGSLYLYTDEADKHTLHDRVAFLKDRGVAARVLEKEQITKAEPRIGPKVTAALECDEDISVYPPAFVNSLLQGARAKGASFHSGTSVKEILLDNEGRVSGVDTDAGVVKARWVINCMGVWSPPVSEAIGVPLPIQPRHGVIVVTEPVPGFLRRNVTEAGYISAKGPSSQSAADPYGIGFIAEPTFRGNLLLGSSRVFRGHSTTVPLEIVDAIVRRALSFIPDLASVNVIRAFAGLRPWTPDGRPIVGTTSVPGYILATGHEGEGIALAPVTGRIVSDLVRDGQTDLPIEALNVDRFQASEVRQ